MTHGCDVHGRVPVGEDDAWETCGALSALSECPSRFDLRIVGPWRRRLTVEMHLRKKIPTWKVRQSTHRFRLHATA